MLIKPQVDQGAFLLMNRATQRAFQLLDTVVAEQTIGMAIAKPGVAKSYAITAWRRKHSPGGLNPVRHICLEAYAGARPRQLLYALAEGLGLPRLAAPNMDALHTQIIERLASDPVLIILDEADLLRVVTFDLLRSIWDRVGYLRGTDGSAAFPLALFGTPRLRDMLLREDLERLRRRVWQTAELPTMNQREVELALRGKWPDLQCDVDGLQELTRLSGGSFGWLDKIVPIAAKLAAKDGKVITARIVRETAKYVVGIE